MYDIFWSRYEKRFSKEPFYTHNMLTRAQMRARTDPGVVVVMKALLGLWRTEEVMLVMCTCHDL